MKKILFIILILLIAPRCNAEWKTLGDHVVEDELDVGGIGTFDTSVNIGGTLDMQDNEITNTGYMSFDLSPTVSHGEGVLHWDDDNGTLELGMPGGVVHLQMGQEVILRVQNTSGSTIPNGAAVYVSGATGTKPTVALASATNHIVASATIALATEEILPGQFGYVTVFGLVRDIDTSMVSADGRPIFLSTTPGVLSATLPTQPNSQVFIGVVLRKHATEGVLLVKIIPQPNLEELSDMLVSGAAHNDLIQRNTITGVWESTDDITVSTVTSNTVITDYITDGTNTTTPLEIKTAYDHSQTTTGNPHDIDLTDLTTYDHADLQNILGNGDLHINTTERTEYDTAYTHSQDNTQAHSDYLINNGDDETTGILTADGFKSVSTNELTGSQLDITKTFDTPVGFQSILNPIIKADVTIEDGAAGSGIFLAAPVLDMNMTITKGAGFLAGISIGEKGLYNFTQTDLGAVSVSSPVMKIEYNGASALGSNGALNVIATGDSVNTGVFIAAKTVASNSGSALTVGYRGWASTGVGGTGDATLIGVEGYTVPQATAYAAVAIQGNPKSVGTMENDQKMSFRGIRGHMLNYGGSLIIATTEYNRPKDYTTTHLDFLNNTGELYVEEASEFDGALYTDSARYKNLTKVSSSTYTVDADDSTIWCVTDSNTVTITLPTTSTGRYLEVKNMGDSDYNCVLDGAGTDTVDGELTYDLLDGEAASVTCDTTEWGVM